MLSSVTGHGVTWLAKLHLKQSCDWPRLGHVLSSCQYVVLKILICPPAHEKWLCVCGSLCIFFSPTRWSLIIGPHEEVWIPAGVLKSCVRVTFTVYLTCCFCLETPSRVMYLCPYVLWPDVGYVVYRPGFGQLGCWPLQHYNFGPEPMCWSQHSCFCSFCSSLTFLETPLIYNLHIPLWIVHDYRIEKRQDQTRPE